MRQVAEYRAACLLGTAVLEIVQDVHKVNVRVVRRIIGVEVFVYIAIGKIFCAHIIEMV